MQTTLAIVSFGTLILTCGGLGLMLVRWTQPQLRGTSWLGVAFLNGAFGAAFLLLRGHWLLQVLGADVTMLLSLILLHIAVLRVLDQDALPLWRGACLLGTQMVVDCFLTTGYLPGSARVCCLSLLMALQSGATATTLLRARERPKARAPACFSAGLLICFAVVNLLHGVVHVLARNRDVRIDFALLAFAAYVTVALGLAFGFFWMTTAILIAEVEEAASTDPLTRVFNRRVFLRWCDRELARSSRTGAPFSLLMVDLDHFKHINDTYGHLTGDEVLCAAVERMQDAVRGIDVVCRWGGEEFAVLLPNASIDATQIVAERIRSNILRTELSPDLPPEARAGFRLTASIGSATYRDVGDGISAMLQRADDALYKAKRNGRNRVLSSA